jgi:hypothetical protein
MSNYIRRYDRVAFVVLLLLTIVAGIIAVFYVLTGRLGGAKWLATTGLLATVTGVIQLEVSGLFDRILEHYGNEEKYPYGPPSYITREVIDNPDRPVSSWMRTLCFFNMRTGFWLIVCGTLIQVCAVWL